MATDDFIHITTGQNYEKITHIDGVQTTVCAHRFEVIAKPNSEVQDQQVLQALRDWLKWRRETMLSESGCVSG
jgi:hypothetical protein